MSTHASNCGYARPAYVSWLLGLGVVLFLGFDGQSPARSMPGALYADTILIVKHERKLYLLRDNYLLRSYRIALGLSPTGAKERQWDFRTPEGSYVIDFRQEHSHYFKALHISYPSAADVKRASAMHLPTGGDIFIHGEPNRPTKPVSYYKTRDWTNGCIALSDEDLQDLWDLTAGKTYVAIVP
ncbi:MAG: L,D-transpeptidase family protein [Steroidobacteraceae bacterium]